MALSFGSGPEAEGVKVSVRLTMGVPPPASDMSTSFWPSGPTSSASMSSGNVCESLVNVTRAWPMTPATPFTSMVAGYGEAVPRLLMMISAPLANVRSPPSVKWNVTVPRFSTPS